MTTTQFMVNGSNGEIEVVDTFFEAVSVKVTWMIVDPTLKVTIDEFDAKTVNEDWFGWSDAPGGCQHDWQPTDSQGYSMECANGCGAMWSIEEFEAGFGAQVDADLDAGASWPEIVEQYGEDTALANADMLYRDAEASWYRFMVA